MTVRLAVPFLAAVALCACSASPAPSAPVDDAGTDGGVDIGVDGADPNGSTFDLTVHGTGFGPQWTLTDEPSIELLLAAQDADTKERIGWEAKVVQRPADDFTFTWPGRLKRGARYAVGLGGWPTYSYFEIPSVKGNVTLEIDDAAATNGAKRYLDAFDVLDTRVALKPGRFEAAIPSTGTKIAFVVGSEGYVNLAQLLFGCSGSTSTCGNYGGHSVVPCTRTFVRGDTMKAKVSDSTSSGLSIVTSVSVQGDALSIDGTVKRANCCSEPVKLVANRVDGNAAGCR